MCPICKECTTWNLSDICTPAKINRMFDNVFTVLFALIMNFWGLTEFF